MKPKRSFASVALEILAVFLGLIAETLRRILNEGVAKECGVELTGVTVTRRDVNAGAIL